MDDKPVYDPVTELIHKKSREINLLAKENTELRSMLYDEQRKSEKLLDRIGTLEEALEKCRTS